MICKITNFLRIFFQPKKIRKIRYILRMKKIRKIRILDLWFIPVSTSCGASVKLEKGIHTNINSMGKETPTCHKSMFNYLYDEGYITSVAYVNITQMTSDLCIPTSFLWDER